MRRRPGSAARALGRFTAGLAAAMLVSGGAAHAAPAAGPTNDPGSSLQWHLGAIGAPDAWRVSTGKGATIAIVDSGVELEHDDLKGGRITAAVSCLDTGGDPSACVPGGQDDDGHGTHVAGIAAATTGNGIGVAGVAPDADLLVVKVLREQCVALCEASGTAGDVAAGIRWATDHGATVINLSLGSSTQSVFGPGFAAAIEYAWNGGAIPVVAAGNDFVVGSGFSSEPAIVVGGLNKSGTKASYSSGVGSAKWAISAPGGELDTTGTCKSDPQGILSTYWETSQPSAYACLAGTSMAAPQVSAAAAILRSAGLSPAETVQRLMTTARDIGDPGRDSTYGYGALDLAAATEGLGAVPTAATGPDTTELDTTTSTPVSDGESAAHPSTTAAPAASTTPTSEAVVALPTATTAPPTTARAATVPARGGAQGDDLPPGPVAAAVLLAAGVGVSSGWSLLRSAAWTRRTP